MTHPTRAAGRWSARRTGARAFDALASAVAVVAVMASTVSSHPGARDDGDAEAGRAFSAVAPLHELPSPETMVGAYSGAPYTYPSDLTIKKSGVHDLVVKDVTWDGKPFEAPIYYGARVARWFRGAAFGTMVDFTHSKTIARLAEEKSFTGTVRGAPAPARAALATVFKKLEFSHGHNMLTFNGLARLPTLAGVIAPYAGLGGGVALPHTEVDMVGDATRTYEYQYAGLLGQALFGVEIRMPRVSVFIEYKFTFAPYRVPLSERNSKRTLFEDLRLQWRSWVAGEEPPNGVLDATLASHQIISGLGVRSASPATAPTP